MRHRSSPQLSEANVDLTPMLDVVFILLIFFIVTSTFIKEDAIALEPPPPQCLNCEQPIQTAIQIYVDAKNTIRIGSKLQDLSTVRSSIERLRAESPGAAVIIQAHAEAQSGLLIQLRDIVYDAKIERVNITR